MTEVGQTITLGLTRKSLEAIVIHACPNCDAPGVYKADERTLRFWPGCYDEKKVNQPVGKLCPNCNMRRKRDRNLGELTASMPLWLWRCVLAFKWCLIKTKLFT